MTVAGKRCQIDLVDGTRTEAIARGRIFGDDRGHALVVGDFVTAIGKGGQWSVDSVLPRRNEFVRQGLRKERQVLFSNVDRVLVFASLAEPQTKAAAIDRFLVAALRAEIPLALVVTKTDLDADHKREQELRALYTGFDLPVFPVSNATGDGVAALGDFLTHGVSAVVGNSGVGKSSLLNKLIPGLDLMVREVSTWSGKGIHTTTAALLVRHGQSGVLIDTPGMKSFAPYGITRENLAELFPEIADLAPDCRFSDCRHLVEPGCAVLDAVKERRFPESRWSSYQRLYEEIAEPY